MNLWFRMFLVFIEGWRSSRIAVLGESKLHFRTWFTDLDFNLHMNNGRYLTFMDLGRIDLMVRTGLMQTILQDKWMPVVGSAHVTFRRSLRPFQAFQLTTQVVAWDQKWFYMEQTFYSNNKLYARGLVKASLMDRDGLIPTEKILALLGGDPLPPPLPLRWQQIVVGDQNLHLE